MACPPFCPHPGMVGTARRRAFAHPTILRATLRPGHATLPSPCGAAKLCKKQITHGRNMSEIADAPNLADMIRAQGKARGYTTAFEFEGRNPSFAGFDIHTNRVANGLKA